jgi:hypothetical protein
MASLIDVDHRLSMKLRATMNTCMPSPADSLKIYSHENLIACVELGRTLSCKVSTYTFLFKATKGS